MSKFRRQVEFVIRRKLSCLSKELNSKQQTAIMISIRYLLENL